MLVWSQISCTSTLHGPIDKQNIAKQLATAYDYHLLNQQARPISLTQLANALRTSDVIFIGEYHGNQGSHLLQMQLFAKLQQYNATTARPMILSMEMFNRDQQAVLDDYLASKIGEHYLIHEAPTWKNYAGSYRPLIEFAKQHAVPVIAANAPDAIVRCIGRQGEDYFEQLDTRNKSTIAKQPFAEIPDYEEKFFAAMSGSEHMPKEQLRPGYLAQITRDNTMAESIARALKQRPNSQVIHLNGSFHSEDHLGTVGALKRLNPALNIKVITPIRLDELGDSKPSAKDDFYYVINPQPEEFVDEEYMNKTHKKLFSKSSKKANACQASP